MKGRILIIDDEQEFSRVVAEHLSDDGYEVATEKTAKDALILAKKNKFDVALLDVKLPDMDGLTLLPQLKEAQDTVEVIVVTGYSTIEDAVRAIKLGALDYVSKPARLSEIDAVIQKAIEIGALRTETIKWREKAARSNYIPELIGQSHAIETVRKQINEVAPTNSTVLIGGESGTGKEVVAQTIHRLSQRAANPFVIIDCAALPQSTIEDELFGHEKGSFTGAHTNKLGLVEIADKGTIFIDEVAEMPVECQSRFLRILETGEFRRIGGIKMLHTDLRILVATRRSLEQEVKAAKFRDDLFYRLNVYSIIIPPLRERKEDILELTKHFILRRRQPENRYIRLDEPVIQKLTDYDWPGNVRELANIIERALITCKNGIIKADDIIIRTTANSIASSIVTTKPLEEMERELITHALQETGGNKRAASRLLKISLRNLYRKIEHYKLIG